MFSRTVVEKRNGSCGTKPTERRKTAGKAQLLREQDFEIVGEAGNGKAALMLAMELQPDIVLLDIFREPN